MAALIAIAAAPSSSRADVFRVQGSTTVNTRLVEPHKAEIEAAAGHRIEVIANMSSTGLIALAEGRAELAMISAGIEQETSAIRAKMPEFPFNMMRSFEVARVRVAVAVHPSNPIRKMSQEHLRRVLLGDLLNWSELGGPQLPIRLVAVKDGGGVAATVQSRVIEGRPFAAPNAIRLESRRQVAKVIAQEPAALGLVQPYLLPEQGLPEVILDQPIEQVLSIVAFGDPSPATRKLIDAIRAVAVKRMM